MRKFFKFLVGTASLAALAGGAYYFDDFDDDDFDDFDDFDDDDFDNDDDEIEVNMNEEVVPEKETENNTEEDA